ncbi:MAG: hypothetical protein IJ867_06955 [Clostridia bacterium]|nr:hypothetical protein [Clostridia bacterium]
MKKIYEAKGKSKRIIIEINNDYEAHQRYTFQKDTIGLPEMVMVTRVKDFPFDGVVDSIWNINGITRTLSRRWERYYHYGAFS